jgi:Peptidase A4 family
VIAVQLTLHHWFYLYIVWFFSLLLVAVTAPGQKTQGSEPAARRRRARVRALLLGAALGATLAGVSAASAGAATITSTNWGGYAVTNGTFRKVSGTWTVPTVNCSTRRPAYSAAWVGLGGFADNANGLEQAGTDMDCTSEGHARYSAWYEMLPAGSITIGMKVHAGDRMSGTVQVSGTQVSFRLRNRTTGKSFTKKSHTSTPDVSSAEWIIEAPSVCDQNNRCTILPLTDFGTAPFSHAVVTNTSGHRGTISDGSWSRNKLKLRTKGQSKSDSDGAVPSKLASAGAAFSVTYQSSVSRSRTAARRFR